MRSNFSYYVHAEVTKYISLQEHQAKCAPCVFMSHAWILSPPTPGVALRCCFFVAIHKRSCIKPQYLHIGENGGFWEDMNVLLDFQCCPSSQLSPHSPDLQLWRQDAILGALLLPLIAGGPHPGSKIPAFPLNAGGILSSGHLLLLPGYRLWLLCCEPQGYGCLEQTCVP